MKLFKMLFTLLLAGTFSFGSSCNSDSPESKETMENEILDQNEDQDLLSMEMKMDSLEMDSLEMYDEEYDEEEGSSDDGIN